MQSGTSSGSCTGAKVNSVPPSDGHRSCTFIFDFVAIGASLRLEGAVDVLANMSSSVRATGAWAAAAEAASLASLASMLSFCIRLPAGAVAAGLTGSTAPGLTCTACSAQGRVAQKQLSGQEPSEGESTLELHSTCDCGAKQRQAQEAGRHADHCNSIGGHMQHRAGAA